MIEIVYIILAILFIPSFSLFAYYMDDREKRRKLKETREFLGIPERDGEWEHFKTGIGYYD